MLRGKEVTGYLLIAENPIVHMLYGSDTGCYDALTCCVQVKMGDWPTNSWTNSLGNSSELEVAVELNLPQLFRKRT